MGAYNVATSVTTPHTHTHTQFVLQYVKAVDPPVSKVTASLPCNESRNRYINIMSSESLRNRSGYSSVV